MRRFMPHAVAAVALVLVLAAPASAATSTVQIKATGFAPASVTVNANDSVKWTNTDTKNHQVVANNGSFASGILAPGKSYTRKFVDGGTFHYHDGLHPTLKGTVTVKGPPPQVTLATSAPVVKFGSQVTLTGTVTSKKAGETVTLVALPFVSRTGYFHFYVTAAQSFVGRFVYLQRFTVARTWVNVRKLQLGQKSGRIMSVRFVRRLIPRGRWSARIYMPASEMPGGYVDAWSGTQPVVKR